MAKSGFHINLPGARQIEYLDKLSTPLHRCTCCGYMTLSTRAKNERCGVCAWIDPQDTCCPAKTNADIPLDTARKNFRKLGACSKLYLNKTRPPRLKEMSNTEDSPSSKPPVDDANKDELRDYRQSNIVLKSDTPPDLHGLIPLAKKWGIGDDSIRGYATDTITDREKQKISAALHGKMHTINEWLQAIPEGSMSDSAAAFMYLLDAVEEMELAVDPT